MLRPGVRTTNAQDLEPIAQIRPSHPFPLVQERYVFCWKTFTGFLLTGRAPILWGIEFRAKGDDNT